MVIYGAGIAGLMAGSAFQRAKIFEAGSEDQSQHKALLRFRSSAVGDFLGIEFRKVRVHKGIWHDGEFVSPNIKLANFYSQKVIGKLADRSIWNIEPVERFIAPEDIVAQMAERCAGRIEWNHVVTKEEVLNADDQAISTLPMSLMVDFLYKTRSGYSVEAPEFKSSPITVHRFRVSGADIFQTVYFTNPEMSLYRASITGDLLICEFSSKNTGLWTGWQVKEMAMMDVIFSAFGISSKDAIPIESVNQRFGKIAPIDDAWRKKFIFDLTHDHNILSLGRFGVWKNILLDDVLKDISVLKKLSLSSGYDRSRQSAK